MLKIKGAINLNYTYIVFRKTKAYFAKHDELFEEMMKGFKKYKCIHNSKSIYFTYKIL